MSSHKAGFHCNWPKKTGKYEITNKAADFLSTYISDVIFMVENIFKQDLERKEWIRKKLKNDVITCMYIFSNKQKLLEAKITRIILVSREIKQGFVKVGHACKWRCPLTNGVSPLRALTKIKVIPLYCTAQCVHFFNMADFL